MLRSSIQQIVWKVFSRILVWLGADVVVILWGNDDFSYLGAPSGLYEVYKCLEEDPSVVDCKKTFEEFFPSKYHLSGG